jgi:S1-C subfamily serine protease
MLVSGGDGMTTFDWILIAVICVLGWQGWRSGFIGGLFSLVGFIAGALAAAWMAPKILPGGERSPWAPLLALIGAVVGGMLLSGLLEQVGARLRKLLPIPFLGLMDKGFGLVLGLVVGLATVWLGAVVAVQIPGADSARREIRASAVVAAIGKVAPPTEDVLGLVASFDPLPTVAGLTPVLVPPPSNQTASMPGVRTARRGVVRVRARACGFSVEGSGWAAGGGLYVTNAHVVAGDGRPQIEIGDGSVGRTASVAVFDRRNDIAVLRAEGLPTTSLRMVGDPVSGESAVVLGYPLDGPFHASPSRVGKTIASLSQDAYGQGPVRRTITVLRGSVKPGNSGGPLVDGFGQVVGTVFGRTVEKGTAGGFAVPPSIVANELLRATNGASDPVGPCGH